MVDLTIILEKVWKDTIRCMEAMVLESGIIEVRRS